MTAPSSLVRGTKSSTAYPVRPVVQIRTGFYEHELDNINREASAASQTAKAPLSKECYLPATKEWVDPHESRLIDESKAGQYIRLECDEWRAIERTAEGAAYTPLDSENSVRKATLIIQTKNSSKPPIQSGERWTDKLSDNAKREIEKSSIYMHKMGMGFRTFLTLTLTPEWRAQLEKWDQEPIGSPNRESIGLMMTAFLNTLQQRHRNGMTVKGHYRRDGKQCTGGYYVADGQLHKGRIDAPGITTRWTPIKWRETFKIKAKHRPFQFIWVAECPKNANGEINPHIHILMNWHVKKDQFHAWARWIEKTWGKGFAKLEKIRKPAAAACYMAKAARYISKSGTSDQGRVRGNRYNIARDARPPKSRLIGTYHADIAHKFLTSRLELDRREWPEGVWFHRYGFGCNNRHAWSALLRELLKTGFEFKPPPVNLHAAMFRNSCVRLFRRVRDHIDIEQSTYLDLVEAGVSR